MKWGTVVLLLLMSLPLSATEGDRVYVGKTLDISKSRIELAMADGTTSIGFVGDATALLSLNSIKVGNEVRAVFGVATGPSGRKINKLLSIRVCTDTDKECAADRGRQAERAEEEVKRSALAQQEHALCLQAMHVTLAKDSRYISDAGAVSTDAVAKYNALSGNNRVCATKVTKQHLTAFFEACELHHCGDSVGGGCHHLAGYAVTGSTLERALEKCGR